MYSRLFRTLLAGFALCAGPLHAQTDAYPTRAVTIVVPYSAGGGVDTVARLVAQHLSQRLGKPVVIENKPGVSGILGAQYVARARPDGYTLLAGNMTTNVTNMLLVKEPGYDPQKDFTPIALFNSFPTVLVVPPNSRFNSVADVIAGLKAAPDTLNYGSSGIGSAHHLTAELFQAATGTKMRHIPYKGGPGVMTDLMGGQLDLTFEVIPVARPLIVGKRLKALGVSSPQPLPALPGVRPIAELGVPGFEMMYWNGLFAPAGTPDAIAERLGREVVGVLAIPEVKAKLEEIGSVAGTVRNAEFRKLQQADIAKWSDIIRKAGIKAE
ncbi:tripartite tricarboxylate transporter substrate binding protein [Pigmentiphaga soli]|uniref:Tripartite tricarboxylate transporter substrate binding protein n=1 Tax=Pigmentiphaga soli TaxID=1007095 RepID=A0ABP8GNU9_9BURK